MVKRLSVDQLIAAQASLETICQAITKRQGWGQSSIDAHKDEQLKRAPRPSMWWPARHWLRFIARRLDLIAIVAVTGGAVVFGLCLTCFMATLTWWGFAHWMWSEASLKPMTLAIVGVFVGSGLLIVGLALARLVKPVRRIKIRGPAVWEPRSLWLHTQFHGQTLPDEVARGLALILAEVPGTTATIWVLVQNGFVLDPIAEIWRDNSKTGLTERACPFVWDEQGNVLDAH